MKEVSLELFLHVNGHPQVISTTPNETLREVFTRLNFLPNKEHFVFVGESDEAIHHPNNDDIHQPANIDLSIENLELHRQKHVHISAVHRVEVTVCFNGVSHNRRFSPATTIAVVTTWAKERFHVDPKDGADLILALKPSEEHPRIDQHLGDLLAPGSGELSFDLVREITPQG
jgi:hypothetical protein